VQHFQDSFYRNPDEAQSQMLFDFTKAYLARRQKNTCTPEAALKRMQENNPRFILRNYLLHQAIEELEKGNNELFLKLQEALKKPYSDQYDEFFARRPAWASQKAGCSMLSCSS
jgi:serine/tyrosine/threonine adenylyltransferase